MYRFNYVETNRWKIVSCLEDTTPLGRSTIAKSVAEQRRSPRDSDGCLMREVMAYCIYSRDDSCITMLH